MESRKLRPIRQDLSVTPFEAIILKEEPEDDSYLEENPPDYEKSPSETEAKRLRVKKEKPSRSRRSLGIQVITEDIDTSVMQTSQFPNSTYEDLPILNTSVVCTTLCRFCLRQAAPQHLKPISSKCKIKILAIFNMKIFRKDSYPMACTTCLGLIDVVSDFKDTVKKAKKVLINKQVHIDNDEWDTEDSIEAVNRCKSIVEAHRKLIDVEYDKHVRYADCVLNERRIKPKCETVGAAEPELLPEQVLKVELASEAELPAEPPSNKVIKQDAITTDGTNVNDADECQEGDAADDFQDYDDENDSDYIADDSDDEEYDITGAEKKTKQRPKPESGGDSASGSKPTTKKVQKLTLCDICGDSIYPLNAEGHRNQHLGLKPYPCTEEGCTLAFPGKYNLKCHKKRAHGKGEIHKCPICGQLIRGRICTLRYHMRRHNTSEKNHVCQVCGKAFTMKGYLTQHSIVHSGEMPHKCSYCGKRFNNKWSMKTHEKNIHEKRMNAGVEANVIQQNVSYDPAINIIPSV